MMPDKPAGAVPPNEGSPQHSMVPSLFKAVKALSVDAMLMTSVRPSGATFPRSFIPHEMTPYVPSTFCVKALKALPFHQLVPLLYPRHGVGVVQMSSTSSRNAVTSCTIFAMPISSVEIDVYAGRTCRCCVQNHDRLFVNDTCSDLSAIIRCLLLDFRRLIQSKQMLKIVGAEVTECLHMLLQERKTQYQVAWLSWYYTCNMASSHPKLVPHISGKVPRDISLSQSVCEKRDECPKSCHAAISLHIA